MDAPVIRRAALAFLVLVSLACSAGCETTGSVADEGEPVFVEEESAPRDGPESQTARSGRKERFRLSLPSQSIPKMSLPARNSRRWSFRLTANVTR